MNLNVETLKNREYYNEKRMFILRTIKNNFNNKTTSIKGIIQIKYFIFYCFEHYLNALLY